MSKDTNHTVDTFTSYLTAAKFNPNTLTVIIATVFTDMFEFFDFGILSVALPIWIKVWKLTGIEIGLLSTVVGIGAVIGSYLISLLSDRVGRRNGVIIGILITAVSTALISATPERNVGYILAMRFLQGIGIGGAYSVDYSLLQELAPNRLRGFTAGLTASMIPFGTAIAAYAGVLLLPIFGWRPLFLLGLIIVVIAIFLRLQIPETPRFLYVKGKLEESARSLVWAMGMNPKFNMDKVKEVQVAIENMRKTVSVRFPSFTEQMKLLVSYRKEFSLITVLGFVIGFVGYSTYPFVPTFLVLNYGMTAAEAALIYAYIYTAASIERIITSLSLDLASRIQVLRVIAILNIIFFIGMMFTVGTPLLLFALVPATLAGDAAFPATMVYANELYPTRTRASASGNTYGTARIGSILSTFAIGYYLGTPPNMTNTVPVWLICAILYAIYAIMVFSKRLAYETKYKSLGI